MAAGIAAELAVLFKADTSALEKGLASARRATDETAASADKGGGAFGGMAKGMGAVTLAAGVAAVAIVGIGAAAMSLTAGNAEFERYHTQLSTLMGSAELATDRMKELAEFGAKTPFELPEIVRAEKVLLGFGLAGEKALALAGRSAEDLRTVIGDVAAGTGVAFEEVALTFGKFSSGATGEAIARLQELGVVTKEQMKEVGIQFSKSGELLSPLPEAFKAATEIAAEKFGGGMDALSNTFEGKLSTLADTWSELKRTLAAPLFDAMKGGLDAAGAALAGFMDGFRTAQDDAMGPFSSTVSAISGALEGMGFQAAADAVGAFAGAMSQAWDVITGAKDAVTEHNPQVKMMGDMMVGAYNAAMSLVAGIQPLIDVVSAAAAKFVEFAGGPGRLMQTVIGTALVVAFGALAIAAGSAAISIIAALAPILIPIAAIVAAVVVLRKAWDTNFGGIREKTAAVVDWLRANVGPAIATVVEGVKVVLAGLAAWWADNGQYIILNVKATWDLIAGVFSAAFATIKGIVTVFLSVFRGDFEGAGKALVNMWVGIGAGLGRAIKGALGIIITVLAGILDQVVTAALAIGKALIGGVLKGLAAAPTAIADFLLGMAKGAVGAFKKFFGIASPSKLMAEMGEQIVAGLRIGLEGIAIIGAIINDGLAKAIGSMDVENFEMIHRLTTAILGIFKDAAEGIRSLLSFDIVTSADEIGAAFKRLVGVFQVALGQMAELSKAAGQGTKPGNEGFINMDHIANIERYTGAIEATLSVASGTLDILDKLAKVAMPGAGAITALIPFLQEIANAAAVFEQPLGKDEDAIQVFERGSIVAGHIATFAKNVADLTSIKFGAISATFADEVKAAAVAAGQAWAAVETAAAFWGEMPSLVRDSLLVGVKAYAEAVGAAVSILKGAGELDLSKAVFATADLMGKAAKAASDAVAATAAGADWWVRNAEAAAKIVVGVKAYGEAVGAAVGMLATAGGLALDKAVFATDKQLHDAADVGAKAYAELLRVIGQFVDMGVEARTKLVGAVRDYADATSAAAGMLGAAGALDFSKAVFATDKQLHDAADVAARALAELQRVIGEFGTMGHEASGPLVQSIKDFAEGAGAAIDLLTKGAGGINALGEIKSLAGVQPGLIRAVLGNLKLALDTVLANLPTFKPEQLARLKDMGDMAGVFDPLAKAATGINALGAIKSLAGVQPRMIRAILGGVNLAVKEVSAGAGTFEEGAVAKVKAWGEASAATLGALTTAADGLTKLGGKITIPEDLSARVAMLVSAMRTVVQGMAAALSGDGAISVDVAKAGADVAEAVGRIGEAFAPIFDAINAALASPFGRIKAKGQRGDTFRQNIADRIKASLVAAVTALSEALASMPAIEVPDTLLTGVERLATVYDRILDILGKLDGIKIDAKALAALAAVPGILAGGLTGMNVQGSGGTLTMSGGASGGGITINNTVTPTFMPMPTTINNTITAPITVGPRVVQAIAVEVVNQFDTEIKLKPSGP